MEHTTTFTVVLESSGDHAITIHKVGCSHLKRHYYCNAWDVTAPSATQVVADEIADFESNGQEYALSDFRIMDCAR